MRAPASCARALLRQTSACRHSTTRIRSGSRRFAVRNQWSLCSAATLDRHFAGRFPRSTSCTILIAIGWRSTRFTFRRRTPATSGKCAATSVKASCFRTRARTGNGSKSRKAAFALIDGIDNSVEQLYTGWPDRLMLIDREGRLVYKSEPGPFGFEPSQLEAALRQLLF